MCPAKSSSSRENGENKNCWKLAFSAPASVSDGLPPLISYACFTLVGVDPWEWLPSLSAAMSCPPSLVYNHCEHGCPRHCEGNTSSCGDHPSEGCFCPQHQVMLEGSCVPEEACTQCVSEDGVRHQVGDWLLTSSWSCFPLGSVGRGVPQWLAPSNFGSRRGCFTGSLRDREAAWHNGFGVRQILVQIPGLSCISCVTRYQSVSNTLLLLLFHHHIHARRML